MPSKPKVNSFIVCPQCDSIFYSRRDGCCPFCGIHLFYQREICPPGVTNGFMFRCGRWVSVKTIRR